jgi:hypothetical protein
MNLAEQTPPLTPTLTPALSLREGEGAVYEGEGALF